MNHAKPTTIEDLQKYNLSEREAITAAAVLPHLPDGEVLLSFANAPEFGYQSAEAERREFRKRATPIVPEGDIYRVSVDVQTTSRGTPTDNIWVEPLPHSLRRYELHAADFWTIAPLARPEDYDFSDTEQSSLSRFGAQSTHLQAVDPIADGGEEPDYERKPTVPV